MKRIKQLIPVLGLFLLSFTAIAQHYTELEFKDLSTEIKFNAFKTAPEVVPYEVEVRETIIETIPKVPYPAPRYAPLEPIATQTIAAGTFENTRQAFRFVKKPLEYASLINEAPFLVFKDNASANIKYTDKAHGFFSNSIMDIAQSADGNIWLSSMSNGVCKYNGSSMEIFTTASGVPSNNGRHLLYDSHNRLWMITDAGLCYIKDDYLYTPEEQVIDRPFSIVESASGAVWIGTFRHGVYRYQNDTLEHFNLQYIPGRQVEALIADQQGNMWIGTDNYSVTKFDGENFTQYKFFPDENEDACIAMHENRQGLWFSFFGKPLINLQNGVFSKFYFQSNEQPRVFSMAETSAGMWICDYTHGLHLVDFEKNRIKRLAETEGILGTGVFQMFVDKNENLWVSTFRHGVFRVDNQDFQYNNFRAAQVPLQYVSVLRNNDNNIWYFPEGSKIIKEDSIQYSVIYFPPSQDLDFGQN